MTRVLVAVFVLVTLPAQAEDRIFRASLATAVVAHALDTATTADCRARKVCTELNPWLLRYERPIPFAFAKTTLATLSLWATAEVYDRCETKTCRWLAIGLNVAQTVGFSWIAARNARVSR